MILWGYLSGLLTPGSLEVHSVQKLRRWVSTPFCMRSLSLKHYHSLSHFKMLWQKIHQLGELVNIMLSRSLISKFYSIYISLPFNHADYLVYIMGPSLVFLQDCWVCEQVGVWVYICFLCLSWALFHFFWPTSMFNVSFCLISFYFIIIM